MKILLFLCVLFFSNSSFAEKIALLCDGQNFRTIDMNYPSVIYSEGTMDDKLLEIDIENNNLLFYYWSDTKPLIFEILKKESSEKLLTGGMPTEYGVYGSDFISIDRYNGEMKYKRYLGYHEGDVDKSRNRTGWLRQIQYYICEKKEKLF